MTERAHPLVEGLTDLLANTFRLAFKAEATAWNLPQDAPAGLEARARADAQALRGVCTAIAVQIRSLGHAAPSSLDELIARATFHDRFDIPSLPEMVGDLAQGHAQLAQQAQGLLAIAQDHGDRATAGLCQAQQDAHALAARDWAGWA